jgi:hypothetical protein
VRTTYFRSSIDNCDKTALIPPSSETTGGPAGTGGAGPGPWIGADAGGGGAESDATALVGALAVSEGVFFLQPIAAITKKHNAKPIKRTRFMFKLEFVRQLKRANTEQHVIKIADRRIRSCAVRVSRGAA